MRPALLALLLCGCATSAVEIPSEVRPSIQRALEGDQRYLRVSCFVTGFFGDASRKLVTPLQPEEVRLLQKDGAWIPPGGIEAVFPAGTPVKVQKIEFPSSFELTARGRGTPRTLIWVYLQELGAHATATPYVMVLRPGLSTQDELLTELERFLSRSNPSALLQGFSDSVRDAVVKKKAAIDMPAEALEMAWGYPERRTITFEGDRRQELWSWPGGLRSATLIDGRVAELH